MANRKALSGWTRGPRVLEEARSRGPSDATGTLQRWTMHVREVDSSTA